MENYKRKYYTTAKEAKRLCADIFSKAEKYIYCVAGEANSDFYEDMIIKDVLKNKLLNKEYENLDVKIVFGPNFDVKSITVLELAMLGKLKIRRMNLRYKNHFKVVDDKYVYCTDYHKPLSLEKKGYIDYNDERNALNKKEEFNNLWENAEEFDIEYILTNITPIKKINENEGKWGLNNGFIKKITLNGDYKIEAAPMTDILHLKDQLGIVNIINIPISDIKDIRINLFYDMSKKVGIERTEQLKTDMIKYIENESSKVGIVFTEDAKDTFLDLLLSVMIKTDKYIKERNKYGTLLSAGNARIL